jgi:hypothetical protein
MIYFVRISFKIHYREKDLNTKGTTPMAGASVYEGAKGKIVRASPLLYPW